MKSFKVLWRQLLGLSRIDSGRLNERPENISIHRIFYKSHHRSEFQYLLSQLEKHLSKKFEQACKL